MKILVSILFMCTLLLGCQPEDPNFYDFQTGVGSEVILEDIANSQYFLYQTGYSCELASGENVASYKDSIYFQDKSVCRTGDICNPTADCKSSSEVSDLEFSDGNFKLYAFGQTYEYGADLNDYKDGKPSVEAARSLASVDRAPDGYEDPSRKNVLIIYGFWIMAIAMTLYMHAPE